jgi:hypothetical protein
MLISLFLKALSHRLGWITKHRTNRPVTELVPYTGLANVWVTAKSTLFISFYWILSLERRLIITSCSRWPRTGTRHARTHTQQDVLIWIFSYLLGGKNIWWPVLVLCLYLLQAVKLPVACTESSVNVINHVIGWDADYLRHTTSVSSVKGKENGIYSSWALV